MAQAKGSASQILLDFETSYGVDPVAPSGIVVPFAYPFDLGGEEPLIASEIHRANRNPAEPSYGNHDVKGSINVPVDLINFGYWLRLLLGDPVTTWPVADNLDNAAAVDKGGGLVGIPITGHAFVANEPITIALTVNYNGDHTIVSKTANEIVITATYQAEVFAGTETCRTRLRSHVFKSGNSVPSAVIEKGFTDINTYLKYNGVKAGKMSMEIAGKGGDLMAKIDLMGARETVSGSSYDATPTEYTLTKFQHRQGTIKEAGATVADVRTLNFDVDNDLDGDTFVVSDGGVRGALHEGTCKVGGKMACMFQSSTFYNKAVNGTESSLELILTRGVYSLTLKAPELLYGRKSPHVVKGGIWVEPEFFAYYENASEAAAFVATLVNTHAAYA